MAIDIKRELCFGIAISIHTRVNVKASSFGVTYGEDMSPIKDEKWNKYVIASSKFKEDASGSCSLDYDIERMEHKVFGNKDIDDIYQKLHGKDK